MPQLMAEHWIPLGICMILGLFHLAAAPLHARLGQRMQYSSFAGGAAAAYVFVRLIPELEPTHQMVGEMIHALVLLGFVVLLAADTLLDEGENGRPMGRVGLRVGLAAIYNLLLAYTLTEQLPHSLANSIPYTMALGLHLLVVDVKLIEGFGRQGYRRWIRFALVLSLMVGWALSVLTEAPERGLDVLTALMAGFVMHTVFAEELPKRTRIGLTWFVVGALTYYFLELLAGF